MVGARPLTSSYLNHFPRAHPWNLPPASSLFSDDEDEPPPPPMAEKKAAPALAPASALPKASSSAAASSSLSKVQSMTGPAKNQPVSAAAPPVPPAAPPTFGKFRPASGAAPPPAAPLPPSSTSLPAPASRAFPEPPKMAPEPSSAAEASTRRTVVVDLRQSIALKEAAAAAAAEDDSDEDDDWHLNRKQIKMGSPAKVWGKIEATVPSYHILNTAAHHHPSGLRTFASRHPQILATGAASCCPITVIPELSGCCARPIPPGRLNDCKSGQFCPQDDVCRSPGRLRDPLSPA